jgi:hypothetical protein
MSDELDVRAVKDIKARNSYAHDARAFLASQAGQDLLLVLGVDDHDPVARLARRQRRAARSTRF